MILEIKIHIQRELPNEETEAVEGLTQEQIDGRLEEMRNEFIKQFKSEGIEEDSAFKEVTVKLIR